MTGSYVKLDDTLFYGIHPGIVFPDQVFDNYVILTTPNNLEGHQLDSRWLNTDKLVLEHPIVDRKAPPTLAEFEDLTERVCALKGTVYIACRGGHGRSGLLAAALYAKKYEKTYTQTVRHVNKEWRTQRDMERIRPIIRKLGSPQSRSHKAMLKAFIESL